MNEWADGRTDRRTDEQRKKPAFRPTMDTHTRKTDRQMDRQRAKDTKGNID